VLKKNNYKIKRFISSDGCEILAGRDGVSNDYLTFKVGQSNDLWFHVKGESGSHVILKCPDLKKQTPPKKSQQEAASVAAWYSKMRKGGRVPVTMCRVKDISKPKNADPGLVRVRKVKTLMVMPDLSVEKKE